jgi:hypothetical protein
MARSLRHFLSPTVAAFVAQQMSLGLRFVNAFSQLQDWIRVPVLCSSDLGASEHRGLSSA